MIETLSPVLVTLFLTALTLTIADEIRQFHNRRIAKQAAWEAKWLPLIRNVSFHAPQNRRARP